MDRYILWFTVCTYYIVVYPNRHHGTPGIRAYNKYKCMHFYIYIYMHICIHCIPLYLLRAQGCFYVVSRKQRNHCPWRLKSRLSSSRGRWMDALSRPAGPPRKDRGGVAAPPTHRGDHAPDDWWWFLKFENTPNTTIRGSTRHAAAVAIIFCLLFISYFRSR